MIYVYRPGGSDGADELVEHLPRARRSRVYDLTTHAMRRRQGTLPQPLREGDLVVCWGATLPATAVPAGVKVLNGVAFQSKYEQALALKAAGVRTVEVSLERPQAGPPRPTALMINETLTSLDDVARLLPRLEAFRLELARPVVEWLPRRNGHVGGNDLLVPTPAGAAQFWSRREALVQEYRLHIMKGKSIRAGMKIAREGMTPHPWVRSFDGGWRINYNGFSSSKPMREIAAKAVETLGLDFGAVDLGQLADGTLLVLEVNRAPGLEGGTVDAYGAALERILQEG